MTPHPSISPRHAACGCLAPTPRLPRLPIAAAVLVVLLLTVHTLPAAVRFFFCAPSAWLSAQFLGVDVLPLADGFQLDCPQLPVDVSLACSGTTFFAMLLVLLTVEGLKQARHRHALRGSPCGADVPIRLARTEPGTTSALARILLAYLATLAANTARIVLGWHAAVWAHAALPPAFHSGVHLAVGIVVFSGFLTAFVLVTHWRPGPRLTPPARGASIPASSPSAARREADEDIRPTLVTSTTTN